MPKRDGNGGLEQIDISMAEMALTAPAEMKYSDVITSVTADGQPHLISDVTAVDDDDGDASIVENTLIEGEIRATWYDGEIAVSDLNQTLNECGGPYTLKLEIPTEVKIKTTYGAPNTNWYGTSTEVVYTFMPNNIKICYLKPLSMQTYTNANGAYIIKYDSGYNPKTWVPNKGFKVEAGFPTTGFKGAEFSIIGSGNDQRKYRCRLKKGNGKIELSGTSSEALGENCTVKYISIKKSEFMAGGETPEVVMDYNQGTADNPDWRIEVDSYTLPEPSKWAIGRGNLVYGNGVNFTSSTKFPALDACRALVESDEVTAMEAEEYLAMATGQGDKDKTLRQRYLYRREELTNSPYADPTNYQEDTGPNYSANHFSRDVDGTFMGEWGYIQDYVDSGWSVNQYYWTAEKHSDKGQFDVLSAGYVGYAKPDLSDGIAICRGDNL